MAKFTIVIGPKRFYTTHAGNVQLGFFVVVVVFFVDDTNVLCSGEEKKKKNYCGKVGDN